LGCETVEIKTLDRGNVKNRDFSISRLSRLGFWNYQELSFKTVKKYWLLILGFWNFWEVFDCQDLLFKLSRLIVSMETTLRQIETMSRQIDTSMPSFFSFLRRSDKRYLSFLRWSDTLQIDYSIKASKSWARKQTWILFFKKKSLVLILGTFQQHINWMESKHCHITLWN
jgi:hypothetical protein